MRFTLCSALGITLLIAASMASSQAADCVDTSRNNPAFASPYGEAVKPCSKPAVPVSRPTAAADPTIAKKAATRTAAAHPLGDPDHPTVTHTENGTLMKFGETTVCVRGSVTVDISTGSGQRPPHGSSGPEATCN